MKEVERVLGYFIGAFLILASGWILAIATGWPLPYTILEEGLFWLKSHPWENVVIAACLLVLGVLPFFRPRLRRMESTFFTPAAVGEVRITEAALQDMIMRTAQELPGIRLVEPHIKQREDGLEVFVYTQINPEFVIPETAEKLQGKIKEDIGHYTGIKVAEVKVLVRRLEPARQIRVR